MLRGIEVALEAQCLVSGVALIFAAIDSLAALTRPIGCPRTNRGVFIKWCETYLRPQDSVGCTALDLYAARCGVLHTYSADSDLGQSGEARRLIYRWRTGPEADAALPLPNGVIVVEVEALNTAFREAARQFLVDSEMDRETRATVQQHLPSLLCYAPWPTLEVNLAA
jgi:hypothetical protein